MHKTTLVISELNGQKYLKTVGILMMLACQQELFISFLLKEDTCSVGRYRMQVKFDTIFRMYTLGNCCWQCSRIRFMVSPLLKFSLVLRVK